MLKYASTFLVLLCTLQFGTGLYFHIGETERKCFIEEIPDDTTVLVNYKVELYDPRSGGFMPSSPGIGMHVEVKDPDDKPILSRIYSSEGRISFTSHTPGEHVICLYSNSSAWFSGTQLRVHLDIQVGEHAIDYANVAQKEKLSELQLRIRQLLDQVGQITKEQNYQRYREERFRQNVRKHSSSCILVVSDSDGSSSDYGCVANEASQEFLRGKEIGLRCVDRDETRLLILEEPRHYHLYV